MDAISGRTIQGSSGSYLALQLTLGSGQRGGSTGAHGGQLFGSGQTTTGQRWGGGHGGQAPILHGLLHVLIHGGQAGTDVFRTYRDMSGGAGHSVLSMYLDRSG